MAVRDIVEYVYKFHKRYTILKKGKIFVLTTNIQDDKNELLAFLMMILGLFLAGNVIYVFTFGSTHFTIAETYSVLLFIYLLATKRINWRNIMSTIGIEFQLFCVMIVVSGLFALVTFMNVSLLYRYMVGVVSFIICCTTLIDVISLFEYRQYFAKGCAIGITINAVICVIQYVFYQKNISFTFLYDLFHQDSFHLNVYNFCAQGLFLEPSHMNQFLASITTVFIGIVGLKRLNDKTILILILTCCALSTSGTAAVVLVGLVLYMIIKRPFGRYVSKKGFVFFSILIVSGLVIYVFFSNSPMLDDIAKNIGEYIKLASEGSNISDSSNVERVQSMKAAMSLVPQNPFGCGWNMVHTLLQERTNLGTASAFSDMLEMVLEVGVVGVGFYIASVSKNIVACLKIKSSESIGIAVALVCVLIMETLADYAINPCIMSVLALGMCLKHKYINSEIIDEGKSVTIE